MLVLSQYAEPEYARALLDAGGNGVGYLLKDRVAEIDDCVGRANGLSRRIRDRPRGRCTDLT